MKAVDMQMERIFRMLPPDEQHFVAGHVRHSYGVVQDLAAHIIVPGDPIASQLRMGYAIASGVDRTILPAINACPPGAIKCKRGCSSCCWIAVECAEFEAVYAAAYILFITPPGTLDAVKRDIAAVADFVSGMRARHRRKTQVWCPLLSPGGECTIYPARPVACRAHFSADYEACERLCKHPARDIRIEGPQGQRYLAGGLQLSAIDALKQQGIGQRVGEFVTMLNRVFQTVENGMSANVKWLFGGGAE